jgi:hypothetical protein
MANLGLLGALGGLGTGLQTAGQTLFNNEIDKDRELRLEAIRSREYARARADQVADLDRSFEEQKKLMKLQSDYRQDEAAFGMDLTLTRDEQLAWQRMQEDAIARGFTANQAQLDRDFQNSNIVNFQTDDEGNVFTFTRDGQYKKLTGDDGSPLLQNLPVLLRDSIDMLESFNSRINATDEDEDDPSIANLVQARDTALRYVYGSLAQGAEQFGLTPFLNSGTTQGTLDQSLIDKGMQLFEDSSDAERSFMGRSTSGTELNNARERFQIDYPLEYAEILRRLNR